MQLTELSHVCHMGFLQLTKLSHGVLQPSAVLACMADHREDDDFVLAGSLVLHEMLLQEPTCSTLLNETEVRPVLIAPDCVSASVNPHVSS